MQLIALAKNDEAYFKRIDALKQQMLELAQVKEVAKTLGEADMHFANARQKAEELIEEAKTEAQGIRDQAQQYITEQKSTLEKTRQKKALVDSKEQDLVLKEQALKVLEQKMEDSIKEHRNLTAARNEEMEIARKVKHEFETKLKQIKEIAAS